MHSLDLKEYLIFSVRRALFGNITRNIKYVVADLLGNKISIIFYFDGGINDDDQEAVSVIETEVIADFDNDFVIEAMAKYIDSSHVMENMNDFLVYLRKD